jgi:hypothetical protein
LLVIERSGFFKGQRKRLAGCVTHLSMRGQMQDFKKQYLKEESAYLLSYQ